MREYTCLRMRVTWLTFLRLMACSAALSLGISQLKAEQRKAIDAFVSGKDVFVYLPTGFGKTVCYIVLPVVFDTLRKVTGESIVVVVSPLKILMADQVDSCSHKGLKSVSVCGDESSRQLYNSVINGNFQVVYISPEMLIGKRMWRDMLLSDCYQDRLVGVIIDEAHCVKKWGMISGLNSKNWESYVV